MPELNTMLGGNDIFITICGLFQSDHIGVAQIFAVNKGPVYFEAAPNVDCVIVFSISNEARQASAVLVPDNGRVQNDGVKVSFCLQILIVFNHPGKRSNRVEWRIF